MHKNTKQPGFLAAFFGFRRMVSPAFITLFYYLGLIGILAGAAYALMGSGPVYDRLMQSGLGAAGTIGFYIGVVIFALISILVLRFFCELLIVLFTVSNRLSDISATLGEDEPKAAQPAPVALEESAPEPVSEPMAEPAPEPEPAAQESEDKSAVTSTDTHDEADEGTADSENADPDQEDGEAENKDE